MDLSIELDEVRREVANLGEAISELYQRSEESQLSRMELSSQLGDVDSGLDDFGSELDNVRSDMVNLAKAIDSLGERTADAVGSLEERIGRLALYLEEVASLAQHCNQHCHSHNYY